MKTLVSVVALCVLGALALIGLFVVFGFCEMAAYGQDVKLFAPPEPDVCLFAADEPVCLFRPVPEETIGVSALPCLLFPVPAEEATPPAPVDFSRNQIDSEVVRGSPDPALATDSRSPSCAGSGDPRTTLTNAKTDPPKPEAPLVVCYCPTFCGLCPAMINAVGNGDKRLRIEIRKGHPVAFPSFVQKYGEANGWPVLHWTAPSGKGALNFGIKSLDQLAELVKTEPR